MFARLEKNKKKSSDKKCLNDTLSPSDDEADFQAFSSSRISCSTTNSLSELGKICFFFQGLSFLCVNK